MRIKKRNTIFKNDSRQGQLLIEMLVALGILTIGFLGVTTLLSRALGLNRVVSDNYTATYLASEGMEITKNILDGEYAIQKIPWGTGTGKDYDVDFRDTSFKDHQDNHPLTYDDSVPGQPKYGYGFSKPTPFVRTVSVTFASGNEIVVHSKVNWVSRGGGVFFIDLEDHFYNWR